MKTQTQEESVCPALAPRTGAFLIIWRNKDLPAEARAAAHQELMAVAEEYGPDSKLARILAGGV